MLTRSAALALVSVLAACRPGGGAIDDPGSVDGSSGLPDLGTPDTFDVATWNIEWLGHPDNGPSDEALQRDNAAAVIAAAELDLWGLQEIVSDDQFAALIDSLPGYDGVLADDPEVEDGSAFYRADEQKVAVLFRSDVVEVQRARLVLTDENFAFAGRPPLELTLTVTMDGADTELVVIVLHAKASTSTSSWERRRDGADALKAYLDAAHPDAEVLVIGDFNDDIDESIADGMPSPYAAFVDDARYAFVTEPLSQAGVSSTIRFEATIDHQLASDEMAARHVADSAEVIRADAHVPGYVDTTSDHLPVVARYRL